LRHKRFYDIIATDKNFTSEKAIEGYHCAQLFSGMTSRTLYVAGMKSESEFADVSLNFIRRFVNSSAL
jgi:hypothetical protein